MPLPTAIMGGYGFDDMRSMDCTSCAKTFVGFGFGAIQGGLFLHEAQTSGVFSRLTVAEVDPELVRQVRQGAGRFTVNIAARDGMRRAEVGPVEILDPADAADRRLLITRIAQADEAATAVPSVDVYGNGDGSIAGVLAEGLVRRTRPAPLVIYAAENHNHAAEILAERVARCRPEAPARAEFLNTVIGKMSGVVRGVKQIHVLGLAPLVEGADRAFLVEEFNRILVSRPARTARAIQVFVEKQNLLPFEEAKLYGHNAAHALLAYVAGELGLATIAQAPSVPGLVPFVRDAFVREAGLALRTAHAGLDPLFTPEGFTAYADDLLDRMTRPGLNDTIERVGRDPARKLGYDDRLIGTLRLCLAHGAGGARFAFGAACAYARLRPEAERATDLYAALCGIWGRDDPVLRAPLAAAWKRCDTWRARGRPELTGFWQQTTEDDER